MERAIIKALERQYNDILTPLKDSIPKRLNMQVQKLTRRQSMTIYSVPSQVSDLHPTKDNLLVYYFSCYNMQVSYKCLVFLSAGNFFEHREENS